jgi:hypothetical protein
MVFKQRTSILLLFRGEVKKYFSWGMTSHQLLTIDENHEYDAYPCLSSCGSEGFSLWTKPERPKCPIVAFSKN